MTELLMFEVWREEGDQLRFGVLMMKQQENME